MSILLGQSWYLFSYSIRRPSAAWVFTCTLVICVNVQLSNCHCVWLPNHDFMLKLLNILSWNSTFGLVGKQLKRLTVQLFGCLTAHAWRQLYNNLTKFKSQLIPNHSPETKKCLLNKNTGLPFIIICNAVLAQEK